MKKKYTNPELEVIELEQADILTTSFGEVNEEEVDEEPTNTNQSG